MGYRVFFSCWLALAGCSALAESFADPEDLRRQVEAFLQNELREEYPDAGEQDVEITVSNLDPRLKLPQCDAQVQHSVTSPRPYGANISVKTHCSGNNAWTFYVPARIDVYAEIAVMARNLERGSILTAADVGLNRMNISQAGSGHTHEFNEVLGKELKRSLHAGEPVRLTHLKAPQVVRKGDRVVLEARGSGVSVVTSARALANGQIGDQIQVQNEKSQRVIDAEVVAAGRVRVAL
jgi:flagellar basal body P-ring formation protein FlgA